MTNPLLLQGHRPIEFADFQKRCRELLDAGYSPLHYFGTAAGFLYALFGKSGALELLSAAYPPSGAYTSLTKDYPAFGIFERLLYEEFQIQALGHPWLKSVRNPFPEESHHYDYPFFNSNSKSLHEVGVGPVHAGVIEPGHFRFICKGETVEHLEIRLGFQHRGVEQMMLGSNICAKSALAESIAGDTAIGHNLAYCRLVEALCKTPAKAEHIRIIALEMERIAMHLADLSALAADVAYIMGQNLFAALRTTVINSSLAICGSRFGKRWLCPGGVNYSINRSQAQVLKDTLFEARTQMIDCAEAMLNNVSVLSRFDDTGVLQAEDVHKLALSGLAAKASGIPVDARADYPFEESAVFIPLCESSGDVFARARLRYREIMQSLQIVLDTIDKIPFEDSYITELQAPANDSIAISIVEGFRGRIVHMACTDNAGKIAWYRILDPSLCNWQGLALAMRSTDISDFPICNKSFDLSYCGSDL